MELSDQLFIHCIINTRVPLDLCVFVVCQSGIVCRIEVMDGLDVGRSMFGDFLK